MEKKKETPVRKISPTQQEHRIGPNNPTGEVDPKWMAKRGKNKR